jgi:hypothetical protein
MCEAFACGLSQRVDVAEDSLIRVATGRARAALTKLGRSIPAYPSALGYSLELEQARETATIFVRQGYSGTKWFPRRGPADGRAGIG